MAAAGALDQLRRDAHPGTGLAHAAVDQIGNAKLVRNLLQLDGLALVHEHSIAAEDEQLRDLGKIGDDVFCHAIGKIILFRIAAHVGKGQDGDGWLVGSIMRRSGRRPLRSCVNRRGNDVDEKDPHRLCDVLQRFLPLIGEHDFQLAADPVMDLCRTGDASGWRQRDEA